MMALPVLGAIMASTSPPGSLRDYLISLGAKSVFESRQGVFEAVGDPAEDLDEVAIWERAAECSAGAPRLTSYHPAPDAKPAYDAADANGYPRITFDGVTESQRSTDTPTSGTQVEDDLQDGGASGWAFVCVFARNNAGVGGALNDCPVCWFDKDNGSSQISLFMDSTSVLTYTQNTAAGEGTATDTVTLNDDVRHVAICEGDAGGSGTLYLQVDDRTQVTGAGGGGTLIANCLAVGALIGAGTKFYYHAGSVYLVARLPRRLTAPERARIVTLAQSDWETA